MPNHLADNNNNNNNQPVIDNLILSLCLSPAALRAIHERALELEL